MVALFQHGENGEAARDRGRYPKNTQELLVLGGDGTLDPCRSSFGKEQTAADR
ncbi:MAG: hypothetical protein ACLVCH_11855 [Roseburia inulinivorans]